MEKYGNPEVGEVAETPSARFDELNFGVEPLRYCVRNSMLKVIADVRRQQVDGFRYISDLHP